MANRHVDHDIKIRRFQKGYRVREKGVEKKERKEKEKEKIRDQIESIEGHIEIFLHLLRIKLRTKIS